jgi:hypothetical protein
VDDAYQTFFTEHMVESDKKQTMVNVVNSVCDHQDNSALDQDVAAFRPLQQQSQQRNQQQGSNYRGNQSKGQFNNKGSFKNKKPATQYQGSNNSRNG